MMLDLFGVDAAHVVAASADLTLLVFADGFAGESIGGVMAVPAPDRGGASDL